MKDHKKLYGLYIRSSMLVSLVLVIFAFVFVPTSEVEPYRGTATLEDTILPPDIFPPVDNPEPPPPKRLKPQPPIEPADPNNKDAKETIDSTVFREDPIRTEPTGPKIPIVEYHKLGVKPKPLNNPVPKYPDLAIKAGIEGVTFVKILIDIDGSVIEVKILKSSGNQMLDQAALTAARLSEFSPAKQRDRFVRVWVSRKFTFQLTNG